MKFLPVSEFEKRQKSINSQTLPIMSSAITKIGFCSKNVKHERYRYDMQNKNPYETFEVIENKKKAMKLKEMGNNVFKLKRYEVAEKFYTKALQLNLDSRPVWTNRAVCRNTMKKHEDALADCLSALSIDPKNTKKGILIDEITLTLTSRLKIGSVVLI